MKCPEDDGLYQEIQGQIAFIYRKKERFTHWKNFSRISLLLLSAMITMVSGWDATQDDQVSVAVSQFHLSEGQVILFLSTLLTFLTAIEAFFKYSDKASTYGLMHFEFRTLQRRMCYDFEKDPELFKETKDAYFKDYQEILSSQKDLIDNSGSA